MKKPLGQYGPAGVADATSCSTHTSKDDDDDDDLDLFGSDNEVIGRCGPGMLYVWAGSHALPLVLQEDAEVAQLKEERLAEYAARKAKSTWQRVVALADGATDPVMMNHHHLSADCLMDVLFI